MEAKLQTLETFLPALLSRFEQDSKEARRDLKALEAQMREGRRSAFYFGVGTILAILTLAAAVYFGFQSLETTV